MIADLCGGVAGHGCVGTVAVLGPAGSYRPDGIQVVCLGGAGVRAVRRLAALAAMADAVHSHGRGAALQASLACRLAGRARWIHTVHRSDGDLISSRRWLRSWVLRRAARVTAVSQAAASAFAAANGWTGEVQVLRNGIRPERFALPRAAGRAGEPVFGAVMNLSPDKDFDTLLRGFADLTSRWPGARLIVVGDGSAHLQVRETAAALRIGAQVEFLGRRTDVPEQLARMDVLLHAARSEGLGLALLEAMAARVPVVASAVGGIPEVVEDGVTGRLFPAGDAAALAAAARQALESPADTARQVETAAARVRERFSMEAMCVAYRRLYEAT
jgi:glycosyltransferase involved in cell wall biosynthesis